MDRLVLLIIVCITQVGCQSSTTGRTPFFGGPTRVPPPPTGVVGEMSDYQLPKPAPPPNAGAFVTPGNYAPSTYSPDAYYGPGRYWESAGASHRDVGLASSRNGIPNLAETALRQPPRKPLRSAAVNKNLTPNDRLTWLDPDTKGIVGPLPSYTEFVETPAVGTGTGFADAGSGYVGSGYAGTAAPRAFPQPGNVTPIPSAAPRFRLAGAAGRQAVSIPPQLQEFQNAVRQASATSSWETRYDDVLR